MRKYPSSPQVDPQLLRIFQNGTPFSVPYPTMTTAWLSPSGLQFFGSRIPPV
eukprot:gnl/Chilomastix_caulleri/5340.p3 GENE.gnl/Chilomastix_caulleri/5340~~gnl/Chilomastix_caulleri/5340.p3  ORF type:complete len:52 (-),score=8.38 gnl/Chilomastix_caulleri/5340:267-422(-)